ncbi:copia protein [Tanacetum coccineum]
MKDSSTDPLEDNPKIQAFRRELEEYCIKAFWDSPGKTTLTVLLSVKYWRNLKRLLKLYSHARRTVTAQATTSMGSCRSTSWNEDGWPKGHTQGRWFFILTNDEVFAPVARIEAIRLFLAFASFMGFIVYQMDVKSAFLYGTIDEEVYVSQPPGLLI